MPRYDVECSKCAAKKEVIARDSTHLGKCACGGRFAWVPSAQVAVFKPFVHEHIAHKPVLIESWKQYRQILRQNNLHNELAD